MIDKVENSANFLYDMLWCNGFIKIDAADFPQI